MSFIEEIDKAIVAHSSWKARLQEAIKTGKSDATPAVVKTNNQCAFGKWLYGPSVTPELQASPHFKTVCELHTQFHKAAAEILDLALRGKKDEATKLIAFGGQYMVISGKMVATLSEWKKSMPAVPVR